MENLAIKSLNLQPILRRNASHHDPELIKSVEQDYGEQDNRAVSGRWAASSGSHRSLILIKDA
jgi:hypothetical protein